jgi:hypothetical protein
MGLRPLGDQLAPGQRAQVEIKFEQADAESSRYEDVGDTIVQYNARQRGAFVRRVE